MIAVCRDRYADFNNDIYLHKHPKVYKYVYFVYELKNYYCLSTMVLEIC